jgi:hypothetical protein
VNEMLGLGANTFRILTRFIVVAPTVRGVLGEEDLTGVLRDLSKGYTPWEH